MLLLPSRTQICCCLVEVGDAGVLGAIFDTPGGLLRLGHAGRGVERAGRGGRALLLSQREEEARIDLVGQGRKRKVRARCTSLVSRAQRSSREKVCAGATKKGTGKSGEVRWDWAHRLNASSTPMRTSAPKSARWPHCLWLTAGGKCQMRRCSTLLPLRCAFSTVASAKASALSQLPIRPHPIHLFLPPSSLLHPAIDPTLRILDPVVYRHVSPRLRGSRLFLSLSSASSSSQPPASRLLFFFLSRRASATRRPPPQPHVSRLDAAPQ